MPDRPPPNSWWRRPRLSVRALLVLVLVLGGGLGWVSHVLRQVEVQRKAVAAILKIGGTVLYDWQFEGGAVRVKPGTNTISDEVPGWPKWLVDRLGVDAFGSVTQVSFRRLLGKPSPAEFEEVLARTGHLSRLRHLSFITTPVTDAGLAHLRGLDDLESLMLRGCTGFTDAGLAHLEGMPRLRFLNLRGTRVTDAGLARLKPLEGLRSLNLGRSQVTDAGLVRLRDIRLTELWLGGPKVTDAGLAQLGEMTGLTTLGLDHARVTDAGLVHLERLTGLEKLSLSGTQVTDNGLVCLRGLTGLRRLFLLDATPVTRAGVQQLQKALPSLKIDY